jgi:cytochrome oxidase assembly protein ShyY1
VIGRTGERLGSVDAVWLLERRWVAGHLLAGFFLVLFVALGVWQVARHHEKQDLVRQAKAEWAAPAPNVTTIGAAAGDDTRVEATGTFDGEHETVLRGAVRKGSGGVDLLTPLLLPDGRAVLVDRGFVRASAQTGVTTDPPPNGTAVVHGLVRQSSPLRDADTIDQLDDGRIAVPRVDLEEIGRALPYRLLPVWISAQAISPAPTGNAPALPEPPPPDPVNHMQYAIQWFALALIPLIGWPLYLARNARRHRNAATSDTTDSTASTEPVASRSPRAGSRASSP